MSRSPETAVDPKTSEEYRKAWSALMAIVDQGRSFSGYERNCSFLNTDGERFANISAVSGFDLLDDGRAIGLVDWDRDGDLDIWITNRTAPRVRFLQNNLDQVPGPMNFIAVRLTGKNCNRDAIGARVDVHIAGDDAVRRRTLHGGHGFLSQSSKWLHFGVGAADRIARLVIRWPNGHVDEFRDLATNRRYRFEEGGQAPLSAEGVPEVVPQLVASVPEIPESTDEARFLLQLRSPVPNLSYETLDGKPARFTPANGGPYLVNLWASWCAPCRKELLELVGAREEIEKSGLRVVALSVDPFTEGGNKDAARELLGKINWPYTSGFATTKFLDRLEMLYSILLHDQRPFPVPMSFLIDSDGWLTGVYRGAVSPKQLLADLKLTRLPPDQYFLKTLPFEGRWAQLPLKPGMGKSTIGWVATAFEIAGNMNEALDLWRGYLIYDRKVAWPKDPRQAAAWNADLARILYEYTGSLHHKANRKDVAEETRKRIQQLVPRGTPPPGTTPPTPPNPRSE